MENIYQMKTLEEINDRVNNEFLSNQHRKSFLTTKQSKMKNSENKSRNSMTKIHYWHFQIII